MRLIIATISLLAAAPAGAIIVGAQANGFELKHSADLPLPPARALAAFADFGAWWSKTHSYSGEAGRMTLDLRAGGCLCERLDGGGGVEHMRVAYYQPGERIVLTGGLGPLLYEATSAVMDVRVTKIPTGSRLDLNYRAAGFARGNGTQMAAGVDAVLREQVERLRTFARRGKV